MRFALKREGAEAREAEKLAAMVAQTKAAVAPLTQPLTQAPYPKMKRSKGRRKP